MSRIFISYRREDTAADMTDRIYEHLVRRWGPRVFMDIDSIVGGDLFAKAIDDNLQNCAVVLVIIGRDWLSLKNEEGARRIDDPRDYPRMEVAAALRRGIRVIPVLCGNVALPSREELPEDIAGLLDRQLVRVTRERFNADVQRLIDAVVGEMPPERWRRASWRATAAVMLMAGVASIGYVVFVKSGSVRSDFSTGPGEGLPHKSDEAASGERAAPERMSATPEPGVISKKNNIETAPPATSDVSSTPRESPATGRGSAKPPAGTAALSEQKSAPARPGSPVKLDGLWASDFAVFSDDSRRREVIRLELDGKAVFGESWQESWHPRAPEANLYRKFSFANGKVDGDIISFCVPVTLVAKVVEKHRNCYTGKIERDGIAFRVIYNLDHPSDPLENGKFVARRIAQ